MCMGESTKARHDLAVAETHVKFVAKRISESDCSENEKFDLIWTLAYVDLRGLEDHRIASKPLPTKRPSAG